MSYPSRKGVQGAPHAVRPGALHTRYGRRVAADGGRSEAEAL